MIHGTSVPTTASPTPRVLAEGGGSIHSPRLTRSRITERLRRASGFAVTAITAPAGFGKSVALRDFIEASDGRFVRYNARREDGTLLAFVRGLSEALQAVAPSAAAAFPSVQQGILAAEDPVKQLADWFEEHLKDAQCTIVVDDLHYAAADPQTMQLVTRLVERTPDRINWILAARADVGLPVATWMAYGRMDLPLGEEELRFTAQEAREAAADAGVDVQPEEIESLRHLVDGWPVALTIALRTRTYASDLRSASAGTREMVYRYLAEQILSALSEEQRSFALATCVFSTFTTEIARSLDASPQFVDELRRRATFLQEVAPGEYHYHDLFRDFLENELRRSGETAWLRALDKGGRILEERGDAAGALALYTKAHAANDIIRIVAQAGFSLFERGESAVLSSALEAVPEYLRAQSAEALGLHAMLEAGRGRFSYAEGGFLAAIERARDETPLRLRLVHRYALELVRHDRDSIDFLQPFANDETLTPTQRAPLLATLATGYAIAGRREDAIATMQRALRFVDPAMDSEVLARLYQQAAYVYHFGTTHAQARTYAGLAIDLALPHNLYEVAARAYSVLSALAHDDDEPLESLAIVERLGESARKGASAQARAYALITSYQLQAELGDEAALERLDRELEDEESELPRARAEALLPARALRAAWNGDFRRAFELVRGTSETFSDCERRALRASETTLYAFAAALLDEGEAALRQATSALADCSQETRRTIRSRVFLALADLTRGHTGSAHRHLTEAEHAVAPAMRIRALVRGAREAYRVQLGQSTHSALQNELEKLREAHFGGIARLLENIPLAGETGEELYCAHAGGTRNTAAARSRRKHKGRGRANAPQSAHR